MRALPLPRARAGGSRMARRPKARPPPCRSNRPRPGHRLHLRVPGHDANIPLEKEGWREGTLLRMRPPRHASSRGACPRHWAPTAPAAILLASSPPLSTGPAPGGPRGRRGGAHHAPASPNGSHTGPPAPAIP
eukprot:scaffold597_cov242-Prasinococcus_capsulatus_cf.AAC.1